MDMRPEIIAAVLAGEASPEELRLLEDWLDQDPANRAEFRALQEAWAALPEALAEPVVPRPPAAEIIRLAEPRSADPKVIGIEAGRARWRLFVRRAATIAATAVLGIAIGVMSRAGEREAGFAAREIITGEDQHVTATLGDGTVVRLAPRSRLSIEARDEREVRLEGRAYFAVQSGSGRRFRVRTERGTVTVFGTRFDANAADSALQVIVLQGHVAVESSGGRVDVRASEMAHVGSEGVPSRSHVQDVYAATEWLGGFLAFEATPLSAVAAELRNRYGIEMDVDEQLATRTLTGWFTEQTPDEIMDAICTAADAICERSGTTVRARVRTEQ